jgi:integrase
LGNLTDRTIQATKATGKDEWLSDGGARGAGRLYLRVQAAGGKHWYYRYAGATGRRDALALGEYAQRADPGGLTLAQARARAGALADLYKSGTKDLKAHFEAERKAVERQRAELERAELEAAQAEVRAAEEAQRGSLDKLLAAYVQHLERAGKIDVADVSCLFKLHVREAFPELVEKRASSIKPMEVRTVLARLIDAGKGRTAGKLRSYLRAAFSAAARAELDPGAHPSLLGFGIEANPCADLPTLAQHNVAGERTLTPQELRWLLTGLEHFNLMTRLAIEVCLLLGGQRPTQLLRVTRADIDLDDGTTGGEIRLRDPKGRRTNARLHVLPLQGRALALVKQAIALSKDDAFVFSVRKGQPLSETTISVAVQQISAALVESGRCASTFRAGDLRRTAETMLASLGISADLRAQLLSHGLGGVQARHYDRHSYTTEKASALARWELHMLAIREGHTGSGTVVPMQQRAA